MAVVLVPGITVARLMEAKVEVGPVEEVFVLHAEMGTKLALLEADSA